MHTVNTVPAPKIGSIAKEPVFSPRDAHPVNNPLTYCVARTETERRRAFQLVYNAYERAGLIEPNPEHLRLTPFHLLKTTTVFLAENDHSAICTVTLVGDGSMGLPMEAIYGKEVQQLRDDGKRLGEVSCLADRRSDFARAMPVFLQLTRVMAQFAKRQGMDGLLICVHPRHARFYKRYFGFEQIAGERSYPCVRNRPAVACWLEFAPLPERVPHLHRQYFGEPIPAAQLECPSISEQEYRHLARYADCSGISLQLSTDND